MNERWLIVSDSHRERDHLEQAYSQCGALSAVLHAGDETSDAQWLASKVTVPVYGVAGNWDRADSQYPVSRLLPVHGTQVLLTHGHQLGVKQGLMDLVTSAVASGASVAVYGHTHVALVNVRQQVLVINPGSLSTPRGRPARTYAILSIARAALKRVVCTVEVFELTGKPVRALTRRHIIPIQDHA